MTALLIQFHNIMVPLVLTTGSITLLSGIAYYLLQRSAEGSGASSESTQPTEGTLGLVRRIYRIVLLVTAGFGVFQAIIGGLLVTQGCNPRDPLHYVYGIIVLGAIPVAYVYSDQKQVRRDIIIMTIAAVAIVGAAFRALATGPGGVPGALCH